jgi:uncharacterized iron-regulated protein
MNCDKLKLAFKILEFWSVTLKAKKTIKAKIVHLTKVKQRLLEKEYKNLQRFLHGEKAEIYSANIPTDSLSPMMRMEAPSVREG